MNKLDKHKFLVIAITPPDHYPNEEEIINNLFSSGEIDYVHIRKPHYSQSEIEKLISGIDRIYYPKIKLHDNFAVLDKFPLGGVHLNSRNPLPPQRKCALSISLHELDQIENKEMYDYCFISPVFDSISKKGYKSKFNLEELSQKIKGRNIIALGGIVPEKFSELQRMGFIGAALLGHFFPS